MLAAVLSVLFAASPPPCVVVVGTSDLHGQLEPHVVENPGGKVRVGGLVAMGSYIGRLRQEFGDRLLLLDGGDLYQGTLASNLSLGEAVIAGYNLLGYTATAVGNHEFDFGPAHPNDPDRLGVLKQRAAQSKFSWLALNIFDKASQTPVTWPHTQPSLLMSVAGLRVGIIGLATPDTPKVTRPQNVVSLEFREPVPLLVAEARRLRAAGAQLVILTAHIGGRCRKTNDPNDLSTCDPDSHLIEVLKALPPGTVDVAVGGHTHAYIAHWVNGTATIQAGARGKSLGWVEACVGADGRFAAAQTRIHKPVDLCLDEWADGGCYAKKEPSTVVPAKFMGKPLEPQPALVAALEPYLARVRTLAAQRIRVRLPRPVKRDDDGKNDELGAMVAEAMRRFAKADFGVQNLGGVRADLPAGDLRFEQIFEALPFDNRISVIEVSGAELEAFVSHLIARRNGDVPYLAGLKVVGPAGAPVLARADGRALDPAGRYSMATNDFLSMGGEGLEGWLAKIPEARIHHSDTDMREALVTLLQQDFPAP